jgi:hypothetical protein
VVVREQRGGRWLRNPSPGMFESSLRLRPGVFLRFHNTPIVVVAYGNFYNDLQNRSQRF